MGLDRQHYCIYCGSEGALGDKCEPCNHVRGQCNVRPLRTALMFGTFMGRKLAYVSWPWTGEPDAPYVRAGPGWPRERGWPPREYVVLACD